MTDFFIKENNRDYKVECNAISQNCLLELYNFLNLFLKHNILLQVFFERIICSIGTISFIGQLFSIILISIIIMTEYLK